MDFAERWVYKMKAEKLYQTLEKDFILPGLTDDWAGYMQEVEDFLSNNFKQRSMGVVCDFADEINKVYTAVFPTDDVLKKILDNGTENAMLFVHHPSIWDITKAPKVIQQMSRELLKQFRKKRISIYNLHVPLDNFGEYSTSKTLADALGIKIEKPIGEYFGALAGVVGKTDCKTADELKSRLEKAVGHEVKLYPYGTGRIRNQRIAIAVGGGNNVDFLKEVTQNKVNTFITGISVLNEHSKPAHDYAKQNKINVLGGTHYSTERFACQAMRKYFEKLGLKCEFIPGKPGMEDI